MRNIVFRYIGLLFFACFLLPVCPAWAAYDLFVFVEGIPGESTDSHHVDWIDATSYHSIIKYDPGLGKIVFDAIHVVKKLDRASVLLSSQVATCTRIPTVILDFVESTGSMRSFLKCTLTGARVKRLTLSGITNDENIGMLEIVAFSFERIAWEYFPPDGESVKITWDVLRDCESEQTCNADFDVDGDVDGKNLAAFLLAFGSSLGDPGYYAPADLNHDDAVDEVDLAEFAVEFFKTECIVCPFK
jgi:type VI secretion system secreted protein Hcp